MKNERDQQMSKYIVTHTSPDWDAIGGVWLLKRFTDLHDADVVFVNTGAPDPDVLAGAAAVVDTGREYAPLRRRFDHHQLPGDESTLDSATSIVFADEVNSPTTGYLKPLVRLIYAGDTGKPEAHESRQRGIHALLSAKKVLKWGDQELLSWGFGILDDLELSLRTRAVAARTLAQHTVYTSADGLLVALKDAPEQSTFAAMEAGARLVVFANYATNTIGVMRAGEWQEPHVGGLVLGLLNDAECGVGPVDHGDPTYIELVSWYRHEAGFFAGRGTKKAPREDRVTVDLVDVARALDGQWKRDAQPSDQNKVLG